MRIAGITLPNTKRLEIGLTAVYGIGRPQALTLLASAQIDPGTKPDKLSEEEETRLRKLVEAERIEGDLRRDISGNIKRLKDIQAYRGVRHSKKLPSRGQRTKTNARTLKGVKKTMGSGKKKMEKK